MTDDSVIIRMDATHPPVVETGQTIRQGQRLSKDDMAPGAPLSGVVQSIRFDGATHQFVIVVAPDQTS